MAFKFRGLYLLENSMQDSKPSHSVSVHQAQSLWKESQQKPGNKRTVLPFNPNHLFLQTIPTTIYLTRRVPMYLRNFPSKIPYSLYFFSFLSTVLALSQHVGSWLQCAGFSGDRIHICIGRWTFNHWATREGLTACIPSLISFFIPTLSASLPQTFIWRPSSARCWKMSEWRKDKQNILYLQGSSPPLMGRTECKDKIKMLDKCWGNKGVQGEPNVSCPRESETLYKTDDIYFVLLFFLSRPSNFYFLIIIGVELLHKVFCIFKL